MPKSQEFPFRLKISALRFVENIFLKNFTRLQKIRICASTYSRARVLKLDPKDQKLVLKSPLQHTNHNA